MWAKAGSRGQAKVVRWAQLVVPSWALLAEGATIGKKRAFGRRDP